MNTCLFTDIVANYCVLPSPVYILSLASTFQVCENLHRHHMLQDPQYEASHHCQMRLHRLCSL